MPFIVRAGAGLMVWLMCVTVAPAWGQGPQLDLPEESGPAEAPSAPSAPRKTIRGAKPALKGGGPETADEAPAEAPQAEQREKLSESELRKLSQRVLNRQAADQGNSNTLIVGRFQLQSEFRNLRGPDTEIRNIARLDVPFKDRFLARIDVPYFQERYMPGGTSSSGMGDVFITLGALVYSDPAFQFFVGSEVGFPTGPTSNEDDFGRGKYSLGPGVAFGMPIPELRSVAFIRLQQVISVGGDPAQSDLNYSRFRFRLTRPVGMKWWVQMQPEMIIDYTRNGKTAVQSEFEIGRKLDQHLRLFVRPAVGFSGDGVPGSYDWFIRIGIRYMF